MSTRSRLVLDIAMFATLVALCYPMATGIVAHEWAGVAIAVAFVAHVALNGRRVVTQVAQTARSMRPARVVGLGVDALIGAAGVTAILSGLARSQVVGSMLGFGGASSGLWPILHFWSSWTALALGAMHLALHWRWVLTVAGSMVRGRAATRSRGGRPAVGLQVSMALAAAAIVFVSAMYGGALAGNALASHSSSSAGDAVATATQVAQVSSVSNAAATASGSSTTSTGSTTSGTSSSSSSTLQTCPRTGCTSQGCHHSQ